GPGDRRPGGPARGRDGGLADPAVRAAYRGGAVAAAGPRAALGAAVARSGPDAAGARHLRARDPGERARPRSARSRDRPARGGADRTGKGVAARPGAPEREGDTSGDRRAAPARQLRRVGGVGEQRVGPARLLATCTRLVRRG